ncbi:MAG: FAD-binding oxidoreductase [Acidimicrobiales bacterium]
MPSPPTPPIALNATAASAYFATPLATVDPRVIESLRKTGAAVTTDYADRVEASRDWWPLMMTRAASNAVGQIATVVVSPTSTEQVAAILRLCNDNHIPVTAAAGRSGVVGGSLPLFGGVVLDLCGLTGIHSVDLESGIVDVAAGTFGDVLEDELQSEYGFTVGHWPQSIALSTVGGWLACRGAGQLSNRYGKIEDIVIGLDVVLANGTIVKTGGHARQAAGPDLTQLFVGSEGTLGIITGARLRARAVATAHHQSAWAFPSFELGAEVCRRITQRGIAPAALRLYDAAEADRNWSTGSVAVLLAFDEGDAATVAATTTITTEECALASPLDSDLVTKWFGHRNDVSALEALISRGYMVDTMELTVSWTDLPALYPVVRDAIGSIPGIISSTAHLSHSYSDGACLYFTFAGKPQEVGPDAIETMYLECWNAGTSTALTNGGSLSHHHGIGLNRARFMRDALGEGGTLVMQAMKTALDPNGILNPGKLGIPTAYGALPSGFELPHP